MNLSEWPEHASNGMVIAELRGSVGVITLNRPQALNALTLAMTRDLTAVLLRWRHDERVQGVVLRGTGREGKAPAFCAGGDIRWLREAALAGNPQVEDFFTEEYTLNHLIRFWGKPFIVLMNGVTMGGGMGVAQGATLRVVTEHSRLAMPETRIGLFPDVGGGWFLSRCPGRIGEYLALTGRQLGAADAIAVGLADLFIPADGLPALVEALTDQPMETAEQVTATVKARAQQPPEGELAAHRTDIDRLFALPTVAEIVGVLATETTAFAQDTAKALQQSSPLMMAVTLEQVRRARGMTLAEDLRMERDLVRHCFHLRPGAASETSEGVRAALVDKDHRPRWNPARIEDVSAEEVAAFFQSPWPAHAHPLRGL
jgi:enoyl-CoA hydratase